MVNSKKMSKSSIAVIVLSILLVLSMILGLTGAWFFAEDSKTAQGGELVYGSMSATVTPEDMKHYNLAGDEVTRNAVPGDSLKGKITVAITNDVDVYYAIFDAEGNYYELSAGKLVALDEAPTTATAKLTAGTGLNGVLDLETKIETSVVYSDSVVGGGKVTASACTITVKVCQADNIDAAEAWELIKA